MEMKPLAGEIRKLIIEAKQRKEKDSDIAKWLNGGIKKARLN